MDTLTFITEIVKSIAWPIVIFIGIIIFKDRLNNLLRNVNKIKAKDYEIEFSNEIKEMIPEIEIKRDDGKLLFELKDIIRKKPDLAVFEAWRKVEQKAELKAKDLKIDSMKSGYDFLKQIEYERLIESSIIIPKLRSVRNNIAHNKLEKVTRKFTLEYIGYCEKIIEEIDKITTLPKMKLTALTLIILELNALIDTQKYVNISIEEIEKEIQKRNVLEYLAEKAKDDVDFSIILSKETPYKQFLNKYYDELINILEGYGGEERRKWGIEKSGLCLLIAWTNEIIQRGNNWKEPL